MASAKFFAIALSPAKPEESARSAIAPEKLIARRRSPRRRGNPIGRSSSIRRLTRNIVAAALILLFLRTFVAEISLVPTASMEGTVRVGDHLLWTKALYGPAIPLINLHLPQLRTIRRGEIVAFRYPLDRSQIFLKRVVAIGGDRIELRQDGVLINGELIAEPYVRSFQRNFSVLKNRKILVPPGGLFVMGDNRDNSSDSREWGTVPIADVVGEPVMVVWSYDAPSSAWLDDAPLHEISFYSSVMGHLWSRTRWKRMGTLL